MRPEEEFRRVWQQDAEDLALLSQARHGIALAVLAVATRLGRPPSLWVPGYYCESALEPARAAGARIRFYPMAASLDPDWDACRDAASAAQPDLFLIVHYAARVAALDAARAFCDRAGCLLIEDATQALWPAGGIGRRGDWVLYSPRKYLDVPDGAVLVARGAATAEAMRAASAALPGVRPPVSGWLLDQARRRLRALLRPPPPRPPPLRPIGFDADGTAPPTAPEPWMSAFSRWRIAAAIRGGGLARVAAARIALHRRLAAAIAARTGLAALPVCEEAVPVSTIFQAGDDAAALAAMTAMRALGAQLQPWPDQPPVPDAQAATLALRRRVLWALHTPRRGLTADAWIASDGG
jgi:hypothetical protein